MGEELKRPYEISIWEDQLVTTESGDSYYKENKIAVIGSDTMTAPNRVYSPVFNKKVNGEKTLTFSLAYKYYDEEVGDFVMNPFIKYLINERVVKLKYDNQWYEFVIKECEENSETYEFNYTATDLFVQELAKTGYNISFSTELNNNLGTVTELAKTVLKNTDWVVDVDNSDLLQQKVTEPIYLCTVGAPGIIAKNLSTNQEVQINEGEAIYVFYSYLANKTTQYVQFLRINELASWEEDDNGAYIGTNYRILTEVEYGDNSFTTQDATISIGSVEVLHQGYRLVYNQKTTYDPVMERTVNEYIADYTGNNVRVYEYDDYVYTSSSVVTSFVTNGSNFNGYSEGSDKGWSNVNAVSDGKLHGLSLVTYPKLSLNTDLATLNELKKIRGYLEFDFTGEASTKANNYANAFFNSGFTDNASSVGSIARGDKFVFRLRYETANSRSEDGALNHVDVSNISVRVIVAQYTLEKQTLLDGTVVELKQVDKNNIYLDFNGAYNIQNNIVDGGYIQNNNYVIDNVVQTPSIKYVYKDINDDRSYIWNVETNQYEQYNENSYSNYFYTIAEAQKGVSKEELSDIGNRLGIFIYDSDNTSKYVYIEEVELFKYVDSGDDAHTPIMPGNVPVAKSNLIYTFYLKPETGATRDQIITYNSVEGLAADLGMTPDKIISLRNENCEKVLSIEEQQSNCFNLLQTLCETFQCWLDIKVEHDEIGAVKLDDNYKPIKKVAFKEFIGKDNFAGFRYGINVNSIQRNLDSNEFVTKLIVGQPASEYTDSGTLSITDARSNPSKESYILNLNYYLNQGLIDNKADCLQDINQFNIDLASINKELEQLNKSYIQSETALTKVASNRSVFIELYESAAEDYAKALTEFETAVGMSYETYRQTEEADASILKNKTIADIIGRIYSNAVVLNSYSGIITNIKSEYNRLNLLVNGAQTYSIVVSTVEGENEQEDYTKLTLSDYIEGFECLFTGTAVVPEIFKSKVNQKDFTANVLYEKVTIRAIPEGYNVESVVNGNTFTYDNSSSITFDIYDSVGGGRSIRFKLVPKEEFGEQNKGYKKQIEEVENQKQEITNVFNSKYARFIQEGTWESSNYIDSELYYLDALTVSNTSAQPKLSYEINVAEISEIEGYENYNFDTGDKTYIEDTEFFGYKTFTMGGVQYQTPIQEEVIISEVEWHLDEPQNNVIVVQNYKTQFEDLFQRISATVQSLTYNQASYTKAANILDSNGRIRAEILAKSLNAISGAQSYNLIGNGIIQVVEDGLLVQDLTSSENCLIIKSGGINLSTDGGITWIQAITPEGINANTINAGTINTSQIMIMDGDNPTFRWDKAGLNAYGYGEQGYDLNTYVRFDKYGLYGVKNGEGYVATSLDDIKDNAHFGVTWDGFFIKNSYTNGYVSLSSDNDFQVIRNIDGQEVEKIKIGALEFNNLGSPMKYGIRIRNDAGAVVMETGDDGNLTVTGTINAAAGHIGGMDVDDQRLKMNTIIFEPGRGIYTTNQTVTKEIPIYSQEWIEPQNEEEEGYYITVVSGYNKVYEPNFIISDVDGSAVFNNARIRGEINAGSGNFYGMVTVGKDEDQSDKPYIMIDGVNSLIQTSNYQDGAGYGWMINRYGDAVFNNITARGAIKTAVFEYAEIQAVGGVFIFRPSSTIKKARIDEENSNNLVLRVEKPYLFAKIKYNEILDPSDSPVDQGWYVRTDYGYTLTNDEEVDVNKTYYEQEVVPHSWCKVSNYTNDGREPDISSVLATNGLTHVYEIVAVDFNTKEVVLAGAAGMIGTVTTLEELEGGALVDMGRETGTSEYDGGVHNYGIGVNSSDNTVNLPARAISLFETVINQNVDPKVSYRYRGILGTLPTLQYTGDNAQVNQLYHNNLEGTQGIYTDNMYLGDANQYLTFYTDKVTGKKQLKIKANQIVFEVYDPETHEPTGEWNDVNDGIGQPGEDAINVEIDSSAGNIFINGVISTILRCYVYKGGVDITHDNNYSKTYTWKKINIIDGSEISGWIPTPVALEPNAIYIDTNDVDSKAVFQCEVNIEEA